MAQGPIPNLWNLRLFRPEHSPGCRERCPTDQRAMALRSAALLGALLALGASRAAAATASEWPPDDATSMIQRAATADNLTAAQDEEDAQEGRRLSCKTVSRTKGGAGCIGWTVDCKSGTVTGGGCDIDVPAADVQPLFGEFNIFVRKSHPVKGGWTCQICARDAATGTGVTVGGTAWAVCC
uniref:Uncharacterized protein n=1 Tax=Alexandrium catenella TaxID=2925 RepID=A0A7S1MBW4_ALECA